ncbi:DUF4352 domain-containing protein [Polycladomyces subterraneus]|uniref:DUF4352 domain-containing protein n=1 Tax=Polycladomyces subterraneus TaxID=1016997 RepID=A0ABT8IK94_9BACL|nr:DUF4352 domain-containing protein [Polycladomyces subterraneus]MDN4593205.1 DUF4352 domain-containing protein [Polycladomyces subterraneus]
MKKLMIGCGSVFVLFCLWVHGVAAIGGGSETNTTPVAQTGDPVDSTGNISEKKAAAKIGDVVNAGDLSYQVVSVESKKVIKNPMGGEYKPGAGQYLVVEVEVKNNGKEKITMDAALTKLKDQDGAEYEADPTADTWVNGTGGDTLGFFLKPINPHATKTGKIVFDVPEKPVESFTFIGQGGFLSGETAAIKLSK